MSRGYDWDGIRDAYPLPQIAQNNVKDLKRHGREWKGCCPFHDEKSPSFTIFADEKRFHCFGCGAGGDVIDYVSRIGNMNANEAVQHLTGGNLPDISDADRAEREKWRKQKESARQKERDEGMAKAAQRWGRALPIDGANAYLERKQVAPHSARSEGDKLLLPIYRADGDLISVQSIAGDGTKRFQKNAPTDGGRFWIGVPFGHKIICEGFATGASIYEASPYHVCVAFSKNNMHKIAREFADQGYQFILAADSNAETEMRELAEELNCPLAIPTAGSDFNDQAIEKGVDSVRETFAQALIDFQNKPEPKPEAPYCSLEFIEAFDFDEAKIPLRPWLVPGALLAGATHILAAPGGTGKSLFTLQFAAMLATGERWGKWKPKRAFKVLIINAEDDVDEQRRRLAAARTVMGLGNVKLPGLMLANNPESILTTATDPKSKRPAATPLVAELTAIIKYHEIDAIVVDPFAETFEGDENSNNDAKWAMKVWRDDIARATGCAVYLVHHTTKNAGDKAGTSDAIRGAGALVNSARMATTLFGMDKEEASALGIKEEERFRYVKYEDAKSNRSLTGARTWFEKISVVIGNGDQGDSDGGDEVGALSPWEPKGIAGVEYSELMPFLIAVKDGYVDEDGICTDRPFTATARKGSQRWVGALAMSMLGIDEDQAKALFRDMKDKGYLYVDSYHDEVTRKEAKGVFALPEKLEGVMKNG